MPLVRLRVAAPPDLGGRGRLRRRAANPDLVESVNWAGVLSVVLSAASGGFLAETGITPLGFVVTLAMMLVLYPVLRRYVLRGPREDAAAPGRLASR